MGQQGDLGVEVELKAFYDGSEENKQYFKWTPNGSVTLGILNPSAAAIFEPGKEYYVDFTPALPEKPRSYQLGNRSRG